jgi:hypothetical protein
MRKDLFTATGAYPAGCGLSASSSRGYTDVRPLAQNENDGFLSVQAEFHMVCQRVRPVTLALCVVAFSALLVGCGGSSGSTTTHSAGTTATTASKPAQNVARDRALGRLALFRLSDFPAGWTAQPPEHEEGSSRQLQQELSNCLHMDISLLKSQPTKVESPKFADSHETKISNDVTYEPSIAVAEKWFTIFTAPQTPACLTKAMATAIDEALHHSAKSSEAMRSAGVTIGHATVAQMSFPRTGDESIAFQVTLPISVKGFSITYYSDLVALRKGRAVAGIDAQSPVSSPDVPTVERLAALTASRMRDTQSPSDKGAGEGTTALPAHTETTPTETNPTATTPTATTPSVTVPAKAHVIARQATRGENPAFPFTGPTLTVPLPPLYLRIRSEPPVQSLATEQSCAQMRTAAERLKRTFPSPKARVKSLCRSVLHGDCRVV